VFDILSGSSAGYTGYWYSKGRWFESTSMMRMDFCLLRCQWEWLLSGSSTWSHIFVHLVYFYTVTPKIHLNFPKIHLTSQKATNFKLWSSVTEKKQKVLITNLQSLFLRCVSQIKQCARQMPAISIHVLDHAPWTPYPRSTMHHS